MKQNDDHIGLDMVKLKAMFLLMKKNRQDKVGTDIEKKAPRFIPLPEKEEVQSPLEVKQSDIMPNIAQVVPAIATPAAPASSDGKHVAETSEIDEQTHQGGFQAPVSSPGREEDAPANLISKSAIDQDNIIEQHSAPASPPNQVPDPLQNQNFETHSNNEKQDLAVSSKSEAPSLPHINNMPAPIQNFDHDLESLKSIKSEINVHTSVGLDTEGNQEMNENKKLIMK